MKLLSNDVSALLIACISATSISQLPRRCWLTSLPVVISGSLSENQSPARMAQAVLLSVPCGPSSTSIWSATGLEDARYHADEKHFAYTAGVFTFTGTEIG